MAQGELAGATVSVSNERASNKTLCLLTASQNHTHVSLTFRLTDLVCPLKSSESIHRQTGFSQMTISIRGFVVFVLLSAAAFFAGSPTAFAQPIPSITTQPQSRSVIVGTNVSFTVIASGQTPLAYQWYFKGVELTDSARVSGSSSATLVLSNVITNDAGNYFVIISNKHGTATSSTATLTVLVPVTITTQPENQTVDSGTNVNFTVTAKGTGPISYQWFFNGAPLTDDGHFSGSQTATLTISNVSTNDAGTYFAQVSNAFSSATSSNALLAVTPPPPLPPFISSFSPGSGAVGERRFRFLAQILMPFRRATKFGSVLWLRP